MSSTLFPNGQTLISSALTPNALLTILQPLTLSILGIVPASDPYAYSKVRLSWPTQGQPGWAIDQDVCFLRAVEEDAEYSKYRDIKYSQNDASSLKEVITYQRTWWVTATFYGPNAFDHARLTNDSLFLTWTQESLSASNLYLVPNMPRPRYAPELFDGQWWQRADLQFGLNEAVTASIVDNAVASAEVILENYSGVVEDIHAGS